MPLVTTSPSGGAGATAPLTLTETDPSSVPLRIIGAAAQTADEFVVQENDGGQVLRVIAGQTVQIAGSTAWDTNGGPFLWVTDASGAPHTDTWLAQLDGGAGDFIFKQSGHMFINAHAAPADADISNGELALWLDQTNGASKAMFKGKSANGTVVSASVALA